MQSSDALPGGRVSESWACCAVESEIDGFDVWIRDATSVAVALESSTNVRYSRFTLRLNNFRPGLRILIMSLGGL